jgi:hypothetical protein
MKNILPSIALISCLISGQINVERAVGKPSTISSWKTLEQNNYSIRYPTDWDLQQSETTGSSATLTYPFAILSPLESTEDKFRENVNLVVEDLNGQEINLSRYAELSKAQLKLQMRNCKIVEAKKIDKGSRKYYKIVFTWDYQTFHLKVEQYYWILNGKAYVVTFTSEQNKFAKFRGIGEDILNTFTLRK